MTARDHVHRPGTTAVVSLWFASLIMFFAAASLAGLALAGAQGDPPSIDLGPLVALLTAGWFGFAGIETLRRRHFAVALLTPTALALVNLAYVVATGRAEGLGGVALMLVAAMIVVGARSAFRG